jgi:WD40 repeat protein
MRPLWTTGSAHSQLKVMSRLSGVSDWRSHSDIELDFDRSGRYMVSCGEDKNWMIWDIQETNYENKGIISGLHSRAIYSCSWSKGVIKGPGDVEQNIDLIASVTSDYRANSSL